MGSSPRGATPLEKRDVESGDRVAPFLASRRAAYSDGQFSFGISDSTTIISEREATVKKKGKANIPDFSRKRPGLPTPEHRVAAPASTARPPIVKPHSTSQKSGRRGA